MALQPQPKVAAPTAPGLTNKDLRRIQNAIDEATSANTLRSYASAWQSVEAFVQRVDQVTITASGTGGPGKVSVAWNE